LVAIAKSGSVAKMNKLFKKYSANIISADEVRDAVKKKERAVTSDPKILNNRISSFHQYIKRNVAQHNVEAVWNTLNDLNSSITDLLFLSEKKA
jgi:hypothetical protein